MDDLLPEFIAETRETLQAVTGSLVAWEAAPADRALLDQIFRFVHTVKGSCGFLNLPRLQRLSHAAEDALAGLRAGTRLPDASLVTAILRVIDRIAELTEALDAGDSVPDGDEARLIAALSSPQSFDTVPAPPPMPRVRALGSRVPSRTVRLPLELLDRMMGSVSEMVLARNELAHALPEAEGATEGALDRLSLCVGELRDAVTRARVARIDTLFGGLPRLVRDLALALGKQVRLEVDGGEVELDREMIEMVRDPLLHAIRNAVDHGLEPPMARLAAGKPAEGNIAVTARQSGSRIIVEIADDGRGIDTVRLLARATTAGIITPLEAATLDYERTLELVFRPGLSTAPDVTAISGRGVGMDVVRANVERLGGGVTLESKAGAGTRLILEVPLTLTIIPTITVGCGEHRFGIARGAIDEIVRPGGAITVERTTSGMMVDVRGRPMPVADLRGVLAPGTEPEEPALLVVVQTANKGRYALAVETVHGDEDLVIKPAAPVVMASGLFAGTTLPEHGRPMLLLDVGGVAAAAGIMPTVAALAAPAPVPPTLPSLLFRDLDGAERALRLADADRIEQVDCAKLIELGGRHLLVSGPTLTPLHTCASLPERARISVLRLTRPGAALAYAIGEVIDIVPMALDLSPAAVAGPVAGIVMHDGRPIELLDADWLLSAHRAAAPPGAPPVAATPVPMRAIAA